MQKKFIVNLAFLIGINLLVKPFWFFGIECTIQNIVGAGEYGLYFAVLNFSFLFGFMLDFGFTNFNNRNVAQHEHLASKYIVSILSMKAFLALIYAAFSFIAAFIIGYSKVHFHLLIWLGLNQILSSFILFLRSNVSGMQLFKTDSFLSVLDRLLMIIFFSILLWGNLFKIQINIFYFAAFQTLSYFITFLVALTTVLQKTKIKNIKKNKKLNIAVLRQSLPFALLNILMLFYFRIDSIMIERILKNGEVNAGIYASAYRILDAFGMFAYLFAVILLPFFSRLFSQKQETGGVLQIAAILLLSATITISAITLFNSEAVMSILYKEHIAESAAVLKILMFSFIFISSIYIFGSLLTAFGSMKKLNIIALGGVILNISLNIILIPRYKEIGAAWSGLVTQGFVAISQIIFSFLLINPKGLKKTVILLLLFAATIYTTAWITSKNINNSWNSMIIIFATWIIFIAVYSFIKLKKENITIKEFLK